MCKLYNIKDCMEDINEVIDMIYTQWGVYFRKTKADRIKEYQNAIENNLKFPQLYVMKENNKIIGTFTIKEMPLETNIKVPSVWYLMVKEEYRGKNYGLKLIQFLDEVCKRYHKTYLMTEHIGFYEKIGFNFVKTLDHNGQIERLYVKNN